VDRHRPRADDGSLTVRRNRAHADPRTLESSITLDHGYVVSNVELGYATTVHRAQGMTVDTAFTLLRPGMAREVAYVAMTRGREGNHAFVATDLPDPHYDGATTSARTGRQIMEQILATQGAELSATQTVRKLYDRAESAATLGAVHETLVQAAMKHPHQHIITTALPPDAADAVFASPADGALVTAMRRAEQDGLDTNTALSFIARGDLLADGPDLTQSALAESGARDPAALLQSRLENGHAQTARSNDSGPLRPRVVTPAGLVLQDIDADERDAIVDVEARFAARASALATQTIVDPPAWLHAPGPPPVDAGTRARLQAAAAAMATDHDADNDAETARRLGDRTPTEIAERAARQRALDAPEAMRRRTRRLDNIPESRHGRSPSR
jgi:hypothetical protein